MGWIALFPGQGSQHPGMGKSWYEDFPLVRELFELASDTLKIDFKKLCFDASESELTRTENAQPSLFLVSYAGYKILETELGFSPLAGAGHSLGEYTALVSAQALEFIDGIKLTRRRGELMAKACEAQSGGMLAVLGLSPEEVKELCQEASESKILVPANFNAPGQIVISGDLEAIERAREILKERKKRAIPLKVSGAFHSLLMESAKKGLEEVLAEVKFANPKFPVISNLEAKPYPSGDSAPHLLASQIISPVRWEESLYYLKAMKPEGFIEIGPGKVLAGLVKRTLPEMTILNFSEPKDLKELEKILQ